MMKKILIILLFGFLLIFFASCEDNPPPKPPIPPIIPGYDLELDTKKMFFDDFDEGIEADKWDIGNQAWGIGNNGVSYKNVSVTKDGNVVLQANGDLYDGPITGPTGGKTRVGACLITHETFGPGRYEVRMKALPRFGATTAIWTYWNGKDDTGKTLNQEIDIELGIQNSFQKTMTTNWVTTVENNTQTVDTPQVIHNDGEWHTYSFEWQTTPIKEVRYFLDGVQISSSRSNVPTYAGQFWIGHWFPQAWAGLPDFETDYMFVDWVKITPYKGQEYVKTNSGKNSNPLYYPTTFIDTPVANLISNPSFEGKEEAWLQQMSGSASIVNGEGVLDTKAMRVPQGSYVYQLITSLHESFELTFRARAKLGLEDKGRITLQFHPDHTEPLGETVLLFDAQDSNFKDGKYYEKEITFTPPIGTKRVEVYLECDDGVVFYDDLFFNLSKKTPTAQPVPDPEHLYTVEFETNCSVVLSPLVNVMGGSLITAPTITNGTYILDGWYTEATFLNKWDFAVDRVGGNMKLFAKWTEDTSLFFFDDFSTGISSSKWAIGNQVWGVGNSGVTPSNVKLTKDNVVVLQGNGDLYTGSLGKRSGSCLITREAFGPGRYEVRMKAFPRFGATTAMWTFYYANAGAINAEIDIELNVNDNMRQAWFTNWLSETNYRSKSMLTTTLHNDGEWHTYRFDWYTSPAKIEWYIDNVLQHTETTRVTEYAGQFWVGNWFPNGWAGNPNFETDYMFVDWVKITPFVGQPYTPTPSRAANPSAHYPSVRIDTPIANWIGNPNFVSPTAWTLTNATIGGGCVNIKTGGQALQEITALDDTFTVSLLGSAKLNGNPGNIKVNCYNRSNGLVGVYTLDFLLESANYVSGAFFKERLDFKLPAGTVRAVVVLSGNNVDFTNLYFNFKSRADLVI